MRKNNNISTVDILKNIVRGSVQNMFDRLPELMAVTNNPLTQFYIFASIWTLSAAQNANFGRFFNIKSSNRNILTNNNIKSIPRSGIFIKKIKMFYESGRWKILDESDLNDSIFKGLSIKKITDNKIQYSQNLNNQKIYEVDLEVLEAQISDSREILVTNFKFNEIPSIDGKTRDEYSSLSIVGEFLNNSQYKLLKVTGKDQCDQGLLSYSVSDGSSTYNNAFAFQPYANSINDKCIISEDQKLYLIFDKETNNLVFINQYKINDKYYVSYRESLISLNECNVKQLVDKNVLSYSNKPDVFAQNNEIYVVDSSDSDNINKFSFEKCEFNNICLSNDQIEFDELPQNIKDQLITNSTSTAYTSKVTTTTSSPATNTPSTTTPSITNTSSAISSSTNSSNTPSTTTISSPATTTSSPATSTFSTTTFSSNNTPSTTNSPSTTLFTTPSNTSTNNSASLSSVESTSRSTTDPCDEKNQDGCVVPTISSQIISPKSSGNTITYVLIGLLVFGVFAAFGFFINRRIKKAENYRVDDVVMNDLGDSISTRTNVTTASSTARLVSEREKKLNKKVITPLQDNKGEGNNSIPKDVSTIFRVQGEISNDKSNKKLEQDRQRKIAEQQRQKELLLREQKKKLEELNKSKENLNASGKKLNGGIIKIHNIKAAIYNNSDFKMMRFLQIFFFVVNIRDNKQVSGWISDIDKKFIDDCMKSDEFLNQLFAIFNINAVLGLTGSVEMPGSCILKKCLEFFFSKETWNVSNISQKQNPECLGFFNIVRNSKDECRMGLMNFLENKLLFSRQVTIKSINQSKLSNTILELEKLLENYISCFENYCTICKSDNALSSKEVVDKALSSLKDIGQYLTTIKSDILNNIKGKDSNSIFMSKINKINKLLVYVLECQNKLEPIVSQERVRLESVEIDFGPDSDIEDCDHNNGSRRNSNELKLAKNQTYQSNENILTN